MVMCQTSYGFHLGLHRLHTVKRRSFRARRKQTRLCSCIRKPRERDYSHMKRRVLRNSSLRLQPRSLLSSGPVYTSHGSKARQHAKTQKYPRGKGGCSFLQTSLSERTLRWRGSYRQDKATTSELSSALSTRKHSIPAAQQDRHCPAN